MKVNAIGCKINGVMTDIIISDFLDTLFIIITQFKKIGNIISVKKESFEALANQEEVYKLSYLLGKEDISTLAAVRLLSESISVPKNTIFALTLEEINRSTLNALVEVLSTMPFTFGQLVIGPPGSGKSTYCKKMSEYLGKIGRKVVIVNIDPANDILPYECKVDVSELITVEDAMVHKQLGPNGGLLYSMEYLEKNFTWFLGKLNVFKNHYFIFDCPGQVELYSHHNSMKSIMQKLQTAGFSLCAVCLVDSHYCSDPGKFVSALLLTLSTMLHMELPHVNVLSKIDLMATFSEKLPFGMDYYTEVLDLAYILDYLQNDRFTAKYQKFNSALIEMIENYSLVTFIPLNVEDTKTLIKVQQTVDKANGYIYAAGEERSVQSLLACAVGAKSDQEWLGENQDKYGTSQ